MLKQTLAVVVTVAAWLAGPAVLAQGEAAIAVRADLQPVAAKSELVATAHPFASAAGKSILDAGGSAVDAAIAIQLVLSLVEPQSSGIHGGGFLLTYDASSSKVASYDGRETAPASAKADMFLTADGKPAAFSDAWAGGRTVGIPGMVRLMALAHEKQGRLPWAQLFKPAIQLAEQGFIVTPRLHEMITMARPYMLRFPKTAAMFLDSRKRPWAVGDRMRNPAYADLLRTIARRGADAYYTGRPARALIAAVGNTSEYPVAWTREDLTSYRAVVREPLCGLYRGFTICSMGPPSSGATTVLATLKMLERFDLKSARPNSLASVNLIGQAMALAYADRELYLADPAFADVPLPGLLDPDYLAARAQLIDPAKAPAKISAGSPPRLDKAARGPHVGPDVPSTSHWVVVDRNGDVATMTGTVQAPFGSFLVADGALLNNELTDFAFAPTQNDALVANRVEPGKRPRSSMAPTIVTDAQGRFVMALGSAGGSRIIAHVIKTLIGVMDWGLDIQQAIALPNFTGTPSGLDLEQGTSLEALRPALEAMGHKVNIRANVSGIQGVQAVRTLDGGLQYLGGADPRREGVVIGE